MVYFSWLRFLPWCKSINHENIHKYIVQTYIKEVNIVKVKENILPWELFTATNATLQLPEGKNVVSFKPKLITIIIKETKIAVI